MSDRSGALQAALYAAVDAATTAGVYDHAPDGLADDAFPYVTVNDLQAIDDSTKTYAGQEIMANLHVWSRYSGNKEVQDIFAALHTALHNATLTVTGATAAVCRYEASNIMQDPDGRTKHGVQRFKIILVNT